MSAELALRAALIARLRADAALTSIIGAGCIFDGAPRGQAFPFVTLGEIRSLRLAGEADEGMEHRFDILVFSRAETRSEIVAALSAISASATGDPLVLQGYHLANLEERESRSERLSDGRTWRGRLALRAVSEPQ